MTARHAIAVLAILTAVASAVCVPAAVLLGLATVLLAIDAMDTERAHARRRNHARPR